jgi:hypothetical protein
MMAPAVGYHLVFMALELLQIDSFLVKASSASSKKATGRATMM